MPSDPKTVRLNDVNDPSRLDAFEEALKTSAQHGSVVMRQLADAYIRYVRQHGHGPPFPVQLVPFELPAVVEKGKTKKRK